MSKVELARLVGGVGLALVIVTLRPEDFDIVSQM